MNSGVEMISESMLQSQLYLEEVEQADDPYQFH